MRKRNAGKCLANLRKRRKSPDLGKKPDSKWDIAGKGKLF